MSQNTVVLITGANRGLGRAFLERYLARADHTVIAANRDPNHPTSQSLRDLPRGAGSVLHVVKLDSNSATDAATAVQRLEREFGISRVDTVFANAGIAYAMPTVAGLEIGDLRAHMETNVYGILRLYQAVLPLLRRSERARWVSIGGKSGCFNDFLPLPNAAFGATKALLHWFTLAIHHEEQGVTAIVVNPGLVETDMGNWGAKIAAEWFKRPELMQEILPLDVSVDGVVKVVDASTRETHSGKLWTHEGEVAAW